MNALNAKALVSLVVLLVIMAALIFIPAGTLKFWQAWVFLAVYFGSSFAITLYLMKTDPQLLQRRMRGGPTAERQATQKIIMSLTSLGFIALLVVPALDHRFVFVAIGGALIWRLLEEERFLAANLPGYTEYQKKGPKRLLPGIW